MTPDLVNYSGEMNFQIELNFNSKRFLGTILATFSR